MNISRPNIIKIHELFSRKSGSWFKNQSQLLLRNRKWSFVLKSPDRTHKHTHTRFFTECLFFISGWMKQKTTGSWQTVAQTSSLTLSLLVSVLLSRPQTFFSAIDVLTWFPINIRRVVEFAIVLLEQTEHSPLHQAEVISSNTHTHAHTDTHTPLYASTHPYLPTYTHTHTHTHPHTPTHTPPHTHTHTGAGCNYNTAVSTDLLEDEILFIKLSETLAKK